jgi:hypothetical protein
MRCGPMPGKRVGGPVETGGKAGGAPGSWASLGARFPLSPTTSQPSSTGGRGMPGALVGPSGKSAPSEESSKNTMSQHLMLDPS